MTKLWWAQIKSVIRLEMKKTFFARRGLWIYILALMPLLLSAAVTAVAGAQQKGKECEIDEGKPGEVARAMLALQVAQNAQKPEDAAKQLRSAIGSLEKADKSKNPVGTNFVTGKTLVMWMAQPNVPSVTTRGALGFTQNPQQPIDLVVQIDSSFSAVEKAAPECASQTSAWRAQWGSTPRRRIGLR